MKTIGADGATEISLAQDDQLGELVALRMLTAPFADRWEFLRDACRDARQLAHPNIARVFDFYRSEDGAFICREYIEGASVAEFAGRSPAEALAIFEQVAAALEFAHGLGVVHGDLKTSKILRDARGNARLIDFRIAASLRTEIPANGSEHISPQVRTGEAPVAADDIYALGVAIAQTISPERAPEALNELVGAMRSERREARPTDLSEIRRQLTPLSNATERAPEADSPIAPTLRAAAASSVARNASPAPLGGAGSSRNLQYAIVAGVLALAALVVFVALPRWVESSRALVATPESAETGGEEVLPAMEEAPSASKSDVESLLARLIPLREELEASAVERWAKADYSRAAEIEGRGDAAFLESDYAAARAEYAEALMILEELSERRDSVLATSLESGAIALDEGEQARAIEAFDLALAIEPNNATALSGASRAEGLGAVMAHMSAGNAFEIDDDFDSARGEYAKALEIDPQYAPALESLARVEAAQASDDYDSNLSLALVSLAKGNLGAARTHFENARAIRPDSPEVADGLRQLQQIESSRAIASLRQRAEAAEAAENWSEAASHYQTIVETQDNLSFAEEGLERNRELARISGSIAKLLDDPTQLFRPKTLEQARGLLQLGRRSAEGRPKLAEQVRKLEVAVQLASTPISVTFESDTVTEVVIRGVGTLGNFARRDVPLKPGRYVVVGRRNGYRDTRSEILVVPGKRQPIVEVRCTDEI
ncbi:MAG: protein kinase [Deltaproteobacteria bacterium]|nr:protein kinase [Deltaproteobacteria bacterium]